MDESIHADVPHCEATTQDGRPCRARPLKGQRYCRIHAALAEAATHTIDEIPIATAEVEIPIGAAPSAHRQATEAVQELEVEIRNHTGGPAGAQQMALDMLRLVRENIDRLSTQAAEQVRSLLKGRITSDYLDPDFWRGLWMVVEYQINEIRSTIMRRVRGEYSTDAYGMDSEVVELLRPVAGFLYRSWWRVHTSGIEHVPESGGALLVANHAGVIPWDSAMLATAILEERSDPRLLRALHDRWISGMPLLGPALAALGQVPALPDNAARLLSEGELVGVFPEGVRAAAKLFRDRYRLSGFEAGDYVRVALRAGVPIVPVAVIGAEETYPVLANLGGAARLLGLPYLPVTPLFPWLGPLGLVPLPSKWTITIGAPLDTAGLSPEEADDDATVARLAAQLRGRVEELIRQGLAGRSFPFIG